MPNATAGELYRAGRVFDLVSYYRNDKTPTAGTDPHGFLLDPRLFGRDQGQALHARFTVDSPKIPVGRIITTMAKATNVTRSESPWK